MKKQQIVINYLRFSQCCILIDLFHCAIQIDRLCVSFFIWEYHVSFHLLPIVHIKFFQFYRMSIIYIKAHTYFLLQTLTHAKSLS